MKIKPIFIVGAVAVVGIYLLSRAAGKAVGEGLNAITPTNPDNIFARGVNAVGDILTDGSDDDNFELGSWIYDITHPAKPTTYPAPPASSVNSK